MKNCFRVFVATNVAPFYGRALSNDISEIQKCFSSEFENSMKKRTVR